MIRTRVVHRSIDYHRVEWDRENRPNSLEQTLAEEWEKENAHDQHNGGILQRLLYKYEGRPKNPDLFGNPEIIVNPRDAMIAATAVQWLGTNVGRCTLEAAIKRAGFRLMYPDEVRSQVRERERRERQRDGETWLERQGWRWA